ncbi:apolipoprotein N-acyltransferase [Streptomyces carminius]|uniref:Apolipoprotein N-acyltransferase n=1 Tax=Streptomyces carminius TaxID=2665496 RepID=A0A2M8LT60_9ACTN|nr:apolipoprotein N-acyltransferase [Streptomyces carminius]PJE95143.1 apolipoprotein N-acyltransferase [Streptomyces carminius]
MPSGPDTTAEAETPDPAARRPGAPPRPDSSGAAPSGPDGSGVPAAPAAGLRSAAGGRDRPRLPARSARLIRREAGRSALAAVTGAALAAAFPPYGLWPLAIAAVTALSLLTRGRTIRQGAWLGFAAGLPFFFVLLKWLHMIGWDAVLGLALIEALFFVPLGAGLALTGRLPLWPLWGACLWVAEEWARDRIPFGGFPWGRLAFAVTDSPLLPLAALGGAPLVTFAAALTGTLLAAAASHLPAVRRAPRADRGGEHDGRDEKHGGRARTARPGAAAAGALLAAAATTAAGYAVPVPTDAADTVRIAVVQGNVQRPGMDFAGRRMMILNNHVGATLELAEDVAAGREARPDLVIWPENASDLDPYRSPEAYDAIDRAARAVGVPILVGALVDHAEHEGYVENQGIVWDPATGPGASYTKQHPVPFGEYVPYRDQLSKVITRLQRVPRDFWPGERSGVLDVGPARLGDVICFEVAYDGIVRDTVLDGARALVVQTNNATYGRTGQPEQQLVMSRVRAVEHGRAVVTAATSGISAVVAPDGRIEQRTEEFTRDVLTAELPLRDEITAADRIGSAPEWALAIVGVLSCAAACLLGRRGRAAGKVGTEGKRQQK